jgi:hypothetical protein
MTDWDAIHDLDKKRLEEQKRAAEKQVQDIMQREQAFMPVLRQLIDQIHADEEILKGRVQVISRDALIEDLKKLLRCMDLLLLYEQALEKIFPEAKDPAERKRLSVLMQDIYGTRRKLKSLYDAILKVPSAAQAVALVEQSELIVEIVKEVDEVEHSLKTLK